MIALEKDVRADERRATLDQVESVLFGYVIGLTGDDPTRVEEHHRRMRQFMQMSNAFGLVFKADWPNR